MRSLLSCIGEPGASSKGEAVRKVRRQFGLRKKPTYVRWTWAPEAWGVVA
jgi:hypothetical protein